MTLPRSLDVPEGAALPADNRVRGLVEAHLPFVWRSVRRLGVPEAEADDVTQKVFWSASRRLDEIEPGTERSFLFQITLGLCSNERRSQKRKPPLAAHPAALEELRDPSPAPDELLDRKDAHAIALEILDGMELALRSVFILYELEEMSTAEIAALLDIPHGTVASRLRRARNFASKQLARLAARRAFPGEKR